MTDPMSAALKTKPSVEKGMPHSFAMGAPMKAGACVLNPSNMAVSRQIAITHHCSELILDRSMTSNGSIGCSDTNTEGSALTAFSWIIDRGAMCKAKASCSSPGEDFHVGRSRTQLHFHVDAGRKLAGECLPHCRADRINLGYSYASAAQRRRNLVVARGSEPCAMNATGTGIALLEMQGRAPGAVVQYHHDRWQTVAHHCVELSDGKSDRSIPARTDDRPVRERRLGSHSHPKAHAHTPEAAMWQETPGCNSTNDLVQPVADFRAIADQDAIPRQSIHHSLAR